MSKPWEQLEGESDAAYVRFLAYRNLGPRRSIDSAYKTTARKSDKTVQANGQWTDDSRFYNWVARAKAWDIYNLEIYGQDVVVNFMDILRMATEQTLSALKSTKPDNWPSILDSIQMLGNYVTPEAIKSIQSTRDSIESGEQPKQLNPPSK